ncbi:ent-kaurene synthase TSP4, chloroplastic-like isoform X2 [Hevea brasiliensis]|uniref:ent-kaurene synthase TSP4, chloroplastic-like isoform X2 n=1 Tax=Hevea brasiliensis TaxID=3981 RepID=UPI0025D4560D|nr:ent-kaurene synthase TSP4, chloroplastic-like isoform X2 [Hevea brasiliensis]
MTNLYLAATCGTLKIVLAQSTKGKPNSPDPSQLLNRKPQKVVNTKTSLRKIRDMLKKDEVELSVSSYDTAWVAMVPSQNSSKQPLFPQCLNWIMENQQPDGSWAFDPAHPLLIKDSLSSTLACLLALHKWNVGDKLVHKGLDFIASNIWAATDKHQRSPRGFDIIFPGMIDHARDTGLNLPFNNSSIEGMLLKRDLEIKSFQGETNRLAYVAEGLTRLNDWQELMKYQRSNGSLFNSPSATAAAFIHFHDGKCLDYLSSLMKKFDKAVPTIYPLNIHPRLYMIDNLAKLGIDGHFTEVIATTLDDIYRSWTQGSEEIFSDPACLAMAFRLLRMNGYEISSDTLVNFDRQENVLNSTSNVKSVWELYKASQMTIFQNEPVLERIYAWTRTYLEKKLVGTIQDKSLHNEVDYALKHPYANLERIESRHYIENYSVDDISLLKTSYRYFNIDNRDLLMLSFQDFNKCQAIYRKEMEYLERWVEENSFKNLKFARQKIAYSYFSIAAVLSHPHLSDARISWAQMSVLVTIVDDFFDLGGSMEELLNLIELVHRWDDHSTIGFKSKDVEILFYSIYGTTNDIADKARKQQGRCVRKHLIDIWINLLDTMLKEAEWARNKLVPTMYEYITNGYVSFGLGPIILTSLYFLGFKLSEQVVETKEYNNLFMHLSMIGRLLNDRASIKREGAQGKLNSVSLTIEHDRGAITEKEAQEEVARLVESHRRELLRMVQQTKRSVVPKACKDMFWKTSKTLHLFYLDDDGYSSPHKMVSAVNAVINEPIFLPPYSKLD